MITVARVSLVVVRGLVGAAFGFAAMVATMWVVTQIMDAVIDPPPCRDVIHGTVTAACVNVLPGWASAVALVISVVAGLVAAVAIGRLTRGMGASLRQPTGPAPS